MCSSDLPGAPSIDMEMAKEELVKSVFNSQLTKEIDTIKQGLTEVLDVVNTLNGKFKTEITELKGDLESFKNSPERKPLEKKADFKESFEDFRADFLKSLRN